VAMDHVVVLVEVVAAAAAAGVDVVAISFLE
jgi:hypothetical protein